MAILTEGLIISSFLKWLRCGSVIKIESEIVGPVVIYNRRIRKAQRGAETRQKQGASAEKDRGRRGETER